VYVTARELDWIQPASSRYV